MTATLTERYIAATVRSLPQNTQQDVRTELEASIADAVEARIEQGEPAEQAERAVLTDLGDPAALAAGYADRPLHLLGPKYYLTWWRLLRLLLWIVPPVAAVGATIGNILADKAVGEIIGQFWAVGITTGLHVVVWTTLVFVVLERTGADAVNEWSVDSLPEVSETGSARTGASRADLIASLVVLGLSAGALIWDRFVGFVLVADDRVDIGVGLGSQTHAIPMLDPALWPWWMTGFLAVIVLGAVLAIAVYARGGWSFGTATANTVLSAAFAAGAVFLLATDRVFNPAFVDFTMGRPDVPEAVGRIIAIALIVVTIGVAAGSIVDAWIKAVRARRA